MKQKRKIIVAGVLVLIIACGIYYLTADDRSKTDSSEGWICTKGTENITSIAINSGKDSQTLIFTKEEESWMGDDGSSYDNDRFAPYTATLGYMKVEEKLSASTADEKEEYGIDDSSYMVWVSYDDGEEYEYILGKDIDNLGMYLSADQGKSICLIDYRRTEDILEMVESLYDVALNGVKFDEIRGLSLYSPEDGTVSMNRSESPRAGGDFYWNIFKPYGWIADTEKVNELINTIEENDVLKRTDEDVTLESSGLDAAEEELPSIGLYDTYDSEMIIYLGNTEGDYVYCKTNYLDNIYLISKEILKVADKRAEDLIDLTLYYYETPSIETCTIDFNGEVHVLEAEWETAENSNTRGQRYYLDKEMLTGSQYSSIVSWFTDTKAEKIEASASGGEGAILGTITIDRLSPPYQQIMTFCEVADNPQLVQVDLEKTGTAYINRKEFEEFQASFQ